jgi:putative PEP-CTERM system TPR-repeat lipoprotein
MSSDFRLHSLVLALMVALSLAGCEIKTPEHRIDAAKQAIQKSDYKTAIIELKSTLQKAPENAEARLLLGIALKSIGQWENSEKEFRTAIELGMLAERVLPLLAKTLVSLGKFQETIDLEMPKAGLTAAALASIQAEKANAFIALDKLSQAEIALNKGEAALAAAGGSDFSSDLYLAHARLALVNNQPVRALALLNTLLQQDQKSIDALYLKAQLLKLDNKNEAVLAILQSIIDTDPTQFRVHLFRAHFASEKGDVENAEKELLAAEKIAGNDPMVKFARGVFELSRGNALKAKEYFQHILQVNSEHFPTDLALATANYRLGNYEQSLQRAQKVLAKLPGHLTAGVIVAASQNKMGDAKAALLTLAPLLKQNPDNAKLLAMAGDAYILLGDFNTALQYLDQAAILDPNNAATKKSQASSYRASNYRALGQSDKAFIALEQAFNLGDKASQAALERVILHLQRKEFDLALHAIAAWEAKQPTNPMTHNMRAAALLGKKDTAGARKALEHALAIQPSFYTAALHLAKMDLADNKPEAAQRRFESILAKDKSNLQALLALAELAALNRQEDQYIAWLHNAAKAHPQAMEPRVALIRYFLGKREFQKALALAKATLAAHPASPEAQNLLGTAQLMAGDVDNAIVTFAQLSEKWNRSPEYFLQLARAQMAGKKLSDARISVQRSVQNSQQLKADYLDAQDVLISLELIQNKPAAALSTARQIQKQHPRSPLGFDREANIQLSQKRFPQAIMALEHALSRGAGSVGLIKLHNAMRFAGSAKEADNRLHDWLIKNPDDKAVRAYAAEYYMALERNAEAIAQYQVLQRQLPNNAAVLNNLAYLYHLEQDSRAFATAERALNLAPNSSAIQDTLGRILVARGQMARAAELLGKASKKAPGLASTRYHYAVALAGSGNKSEALKVLQQLLGEIPKFPEADAAKALLNSF